MFISHNKKILFYEVPRTASRSITQALTRLDPRSPTALIRAIKKNLYDYHTYNSEVRKKYDDYILVAAHRNPYTRVLSHYQYRRTRGNPDVLKTYSFAEYVDWVCGPAPQQQVPTALVDIPIVEMMPHSEVDFWIRFEHLEQDWLALGECLNLNTMPEWSTLPLKNRSTPLQGMIPYNECLARKIARRFREDFRAFGYDVDSWRTLV